MRPVLLLPALLIGCVVVDDGPDYVVTTTTTTVWTPVNAAPFVSDGSASVFYDPAYDDDIWAFEAVVDDPDGVEDVIGVWADVYDEDNGGRLMESFELYPTDDPYVWYSEWLGSTSTLDPFYSGYTVDLVVYDTFEDLGWLTVVPATY
jgi:hypothetical protein